MKYPVRFAALFLLLAVAAHVVVSAQTVVAFQGGEGTPADNWTFQPILNAGGLLPPGIVNVNPRTGSFAIRAGGGNTVGCAGGANCIVGGGSTGCPMHGNAIQFDPVNVSCLSGVQLSVYHRSQPFCSGSGWDASDNLNFEVRLDGGSWVTIQTLVASGDYPWTYTTNPAGVPGTVPNPWVYNVPANTNTFEFRVRATVNRSDEVFYIDDVTLTTTSTGYGFPGVAGLWNGVSDDNWFNPCNWNNRSVPTAATNVTFPTGSNNDIVVQIGQDCQCNDLTCTGGVGRVIKAGGSPAKMVTVFGNLTNSTSLGSNVLQFDDGTPGTPDGTLNLYGNWTNNSSAADFWQGESTVNFLGSGNQTISLGTVEPTEDFFNLTVNKTGGDVVLAKSSQVQGVLTLSNGKIATGANTVVVSNPLPLSVTGHSTASYVNGNLVRAIQTGPGTRTYDFPLGTSAFYELATLSLTNPSGFSVIGGFFNPTIGGVAPSIMETGFLYDQILNAGVWTLAPDMPYSGSYDITLQERGYSNGGALRYINVKRPDVFGIWSNPGSHVMFSEASGVVTCVRSGLTSFSDFAIALNTVPLAANALQMHATAIDQGKAVVDWSWQQGQLQGEFELERVHGGTVYSVGHWPVGAGAAMTQQDSDVPQGLNRYDLFHTDLNGNRALVASDEIWMNGQGDLTPALWPNPYSGSVHLQLTGEADWSVELMRMDGARVAQFSGAAVEVEDRFASCSQYLATGIYLIKCSSAGKTYHLKLVRQ